MIINHTAQDAKLEFFIFQMRLIRIFLIKAGQPGLATRPPVGIIVIITS